MELPKAYKDIFAEIKERYGQSRLKNNMNNSTNFIIGASGVAASAMAAGRMPEQYSVAKEAMPNLAENTRNETGDNLLKMDNPANKGSGKSTTAKDNPNQYGSYGRLYKKYEDKLYGARQKLQRLYHEFIERLSKLKELYEGKVKGAIRRIPYNPFRKSGLEDKVKSAPIYHATIPRLYVVRNPPKYNRQTPRYDRKEQDLEERLAA